MRYDFRFKEGQLLYALVLSSGDVVKVGYEGVKSITVHEQAGQMAMVPWATVETEVDVTQINLALVQAVEELRS